MSSPFDLLDDNDDDSSDLDFLFLCHLAKEAEEKEHSSKRQRRRCKRQLQSSERRRQRRHKWHHERISWQSHVEKLNHEIAFEKIANLGRATTSCEYREEKERITRNKFNVDKYIIYSLFGFNLMFHLLKADENSDPAFSCIS